MVQLLLILIGTIAGIVTGITGASSVMVVVPLLSILLNFSIHQAIGTSLVVDVVAPLFISLTYFKKGHIKIKECISVLLGTVLLAPIGSYFSDMVPERGLGSSFGGFMIVLAIMIFRTGAKQKFNKQDSSSLPSYLRHPITRIALCFILAGASGFMTGFMGAGGGTNLLLILILFCGYSLHDALGTSILMMALTASAGVAGHLYYGNVNFSDGILVAVVATIAGTISAKKMSNLNEKALSYFMGGTYATLGILMVLLNMFYN
ncbi:sulfite exporter TauE/SafE family protein [Halosquirtibacter xylanolyticus]|uniref:sulfite exporter TauE/SafE family protein n=1 Tax=Halosquirtibacter xylanolyticus TaxID=3374599 RepID=UPI003748A66D|nr:sulfite exporter TauE/SafE family protein [Prolixibacteraceae bacterium]